MNLLITICARGGSQGIPGKNIKLLNGKPLISYSIEAANRFSNIYKADISLSTNDMMIRNVAAEYGLYTNYQRPAELASHVAGKIETITHLLMYEEQNRKKSYDFVLDLDVTSPLRTLQDLELAFKLVTADLEAYNIFSVSTAQKNPYFNMVEQSDNGYYHLVKDPRNTIFARQSVPKVFEMNASFYFYRRKFFADGLRSAVTNKSLVYVMPHICFDLDHPVDFEFISFLMKHNKLGFAL